jgi:hypothetical protein
MLRIGLIDGLIHHSNHWQLHRSEQSVIALVSGKTFLQWSAPAE